LNAKSFFSISWLLKNLMSILSFSIFFNYWYVVDLGDMLSYKGGRGSRYTRCAHNSVPISVTNVKTLKSIIQSQSISTPCRCLQLEIRKVCLEAFIEHISTTYVGNNLYMWWYKSRSILSREVFYKMYVENNFTYGLEHKSCTWRIS